jgi:hypothetical protein
LLLLSFSLFSPTRDIYVEYGFKGGRAVGGDAIDVNGDNEVMATC